MCDIMYDTWYMYLLKDDTWDDIRWPMGWYKCIIHGTFDERESIIQGGLWDDRSEGRKDCGFPICYESDWEDWVGKQPTPLEKVTFSWFCIHTMYYIANTPGIQKNVLFIGTAKRDSTEWVHTEIYIYTIYEHIYYIRMLEKYAKVATMQ